MAFRYEREAIASIISPAACRRLFTNTGFINLEALQPMLPHT